MKKEDNFLSWFENLDRQSLSQIDEFYAQNSFFKDPFNEFEGIEKIKQVFNHMFDKLEDPRFLFIDKIKGEESLFVTWDFLFVLGNKKYKIHGSTLVKYDEEGKINYHRDYWDVGEELLLQIPIIKNLYKVFQNKLKV